MWIVSEQVTTVCAVIQAQSREALPTSYKRNYFCVQPTFTANMFQTIPMALSTHFHVWVFIGHDPEW
jgi:hypothetical protein